MRDCNCTHIPRLSEKNLFLVVNQQSDKRYLFPYQNEILLLLYPRFNSSPGLLYCLSLLLSAATIRSPSSARDHSSPTSTPLRALPTTGELIDVPFACEDVIQEAHRSVLFGSRPFSEMGIYPADLKDLVSLLLSAATIRSPFSHRRTPFSPPAFVQWPLCPRCQLPLPPDFRRPLGLASRLPACLQEDLQKGRR